MKTKYTLEIVKAKALEYCSKKEFERQARPYYAAAHRNKWLDVVCVHMQVIKKLKWSTEEITLEASKYMSKVAFEQNARGAYKAALHLDIIEIVCSHMVRPEPWNKKWSEIAVKQETLKHKSRKDWRANSPGSYGAAFRTGILKDISSKMKKRDAPNQYWTYELALKEIRKYKSRIEFQKNGKGAYSFLQESGTLLQAYEEIGLKSIGGTSLQEQALLKIIQYKFPKAQNIFISTKDFFKDKPHIRRFELDIYIPELRKGIEFNGDYWHSDAGLKLNRSHWPQEDIDNYHQLKKEFFKSRNIEYIEVWESEWLKDQQICIDKCLAFLNHTLHSVSK